MKNSGQQDDAYARIDKMWEIKSMEERELLKAKIIELLEDNHANDICFMLNMGHHEVLKIVHEIYRDGGLMESQYWESEYVGTNTGADLWGIYGKDRAGEYIDANGDYLGFDTEEEANQYIKDEIK
jgi:hypothetical protein